MERKNYSAALSEYKEVVDTYANYTNPQLAETHRKMGEAYYALKDYNQAISSFKIAIENNLLIV